MELRMRLDLVYFEHIIQPQHNTSHFVLQTLHIDTTQIKVKYVHSLVGYAHLEDKLVHILRPHPYTFCGTLFDSTSPSSNYESIPLRNICYFVSLSIWNDNVLYKILLL